MSNYLIEEETLTDIANAIREQTGTNDLIKSGDMARMIYNIEGGSGGVSPTINVTEINGGHTVSVTDKNGTQSFNVMNGNGIKNAILNADYTLTLTFDDDTTYTTPSIRGQVGATGEAGKDGTTPIKGTDYFTEADKVEFKSYIDEELEKLDTSSLEFVNSVLDFTDTSKVYVLPDGSIYEYKEVTEEASHTNQILLSIASDGTPYNNNVGYKDGYRLNSNGVETVAEGSIVSGFIPYNGEDVELRVPNTQIGHSSNYLHVYGSTFNVIKLDTSGTTIDTSNRNFTYWESKYGATKVVDYNTGTTKIVFPSSILAISGVKYLRVSAVYSDYNDGYEGTGGFTEVTAATFDLALGESLDGTTSSVTTPKWVKKDFSFFTKEQESRLAALENESENNPIISDNIVPDYWISELETKADVIQVAMEKAGRNKSAFLWYTDAHWANGNSKVSPLLLKYLYKNTPINKVNFGGDIIGDSLLSTREEMKYLHEWREKIKDLPNHHSVLGNHDRLSSDSVNYEDDNFRYAFLIAPEESSDMVMGEGMYYYIDNPCEKTRYLYIDYLTSDHAAMVKQGEFITEAIKSVKENWHIVAIAHRWWQYSSSSTPTTGSIPAYETEILSVFDAYNARQTRSGSNYFTAQDFTSCKGKVEFCIGGHIHVDYDFESAGGIPIIITTADANQNRVPDSTVDSGTVGTITEAAIYGIVADYNDSDNIKINVIGVGRGTSRVVRKSAVKPTSISNITYSGDTTIGTTIDKSKFSFTINYSNGTTDTVNGATSVSPVTIGIVGNNTVTIAYTEGATTLTSTVIIVGTPVPVAYNNLADPSSADWLTNKRFSTSSISDATGGIITNYIACKKGDVVRVKGLTPNVLLGGSQSRIRMYEAGTVIDAGNVTSNAIINSGNGSGINGDIATLIFTEGSNATLNTYINKNYDNIRLNGTLINGYTANDVIITVNEEIT